VAELTRFLMGDVMSEMRAVPDHYVSAVDRLPVDPLAYAGLIRRCVLARTLSALL
jgi:hypothetical protein